MENLTFTKSGRYSTSEEIGGGASNSVTLHLNFADSKAKEIIVQCSSDPSKGWSTQDSVRCESSVWEKNVTGIAPHQLIRVIVNADIEAGYYKTY